MSTCINPECSNTGTMNLTVFGQPVGKVCSTCGDNITDGPAALLALSPQDNPTLPPVYYRPLTPEEAAAPRGWTPGGPYVLDMELLCVKCPGCVYGAVPVKRRDAPNDPGFWDGEALCLAHYDTLVTKAPDAIEVTETEEDQP